LPEGRILSHDILESGFVRTAYDGLSFIVEPAPSRLKSLYKRQHRWLRGDLQNLATVSLAVFKRRIVFGQDTWQLSCHLTCRFVRRALLPACRVVAALTVVVAQPSVRVPFFLTYLGLVLGPELLAYFQAAVYGFCFGKAGYVRWILQGIMRIAWKECVLFAIAPQMVLVALDAAIRSCVAVATSKRLIEWTSSSRAELENPGWDMFDVFVCSVACAAVGLLPAGNGYLVVGAIWLAGTVAYFKSRATNRIAHSSEELNVGRHAASLWHRISTTTSAHSKGG
jgi:cyclic beta-1,2-glucan synthetase